MNRAGADQRIPVRVSAGLSFQYVDGTGAKANPGTVTVGVTKADGTVVVAAGAATTGTGPAPGVYTLAAASNQSLELLTASWRLTDGTVFTTLVEVVGGFYFTIDDARSSDPPLADTGKYPDADIDERRREVEEEIEDICDRSFVPRY